MVKTYRRRALSVLALFIGSAFVLLSPAAAAGPQMTATATVAQYKAVLSIGPNEPMYTLADYKAHHYKHGEIILKGTMAPMMDMAGSMSGNSMLVQHHLEVHVYSVRTGKVVSTAAVVITITDMHTKKTSRITTLLMQGIGASAQDIHYGNMVMLMTEHYVVDVAINGHHARYAVDWHETGGMSM